MINTTNVGVIAIDSNTPISFLTVGQLRAIIKEESLLNLPPPPQQGPMHLPKDWVTREEALCLLDTTNPTLNKWVKNGKITRKYVEGKPFYSLNSFYKYLDNQ